NFAVSAPFDRNQATRRVYCYAPIGSLVHNRSDDGGAGTGARAFSFADATLPQTLLEIGAIADPHENYVRAFGKPRMIFYQWPETPPVDLIELFNKDAAIRIAHLQGRHAQRFIAH